MLSLSHTQVYFMNLDLPSSVVLDREKCVNSTCLFTVYPEKTKARITVVISNAFLLFTIQCGFTICSSDA